MATSTTCAPPTTAPESNSSPSLSRINEGKLWVSLFAIFLVNYELIKKQGRSSPVIISSMIANLSSRFRLNLAPCFFDSLATICEDLFRFESKDQFLKHLNQHSLQYEAVKSQIPDGAKMIELRRLKDLDSDSKQELGQDEIQGEYQDFERDREPEDMTKDNVSRKRKLESANKRSKKTAANVARRPSLDTKALIKYFQQKIEEKYLQTNSVPFPQMLVNPEGGKQSDMCVDAGIVCSSSSRLDGAPNRAVHASKTVTTQNFISHLIEESPEIRDCIVCEHCIPGRTASTRVIPKDLLRQEVMKYLHSKHIDSLFSHQEDGIRALIEEGKNVIVTTSTSSGKSMVYMLPILQACLQSRDATALLIFPTKALAQDQLAAISEMFSYISRQMEEERGTNQDSVPISVGTYDGDTDFNDREAVRSEKRVILTNPDMLHCSILPAHKQWRKFFANLQYVVIDEAHYYKAAFGIHSSLVLRRLRRLVYLYGSSPKFVLCSATVVNPRQIVSNLTGLCHESVEVISQDGSPSMPKNFVLYNPMNLPAKGDEETPESTPNTTPSKEIQNMRIFTNDNPYTSAVLIMKRLLNHGIRTVAFVKARQTGESLYEQLLGALPENLHGRVACYRAGYTPSERRELERQIKCGELIITISTNALELGVDIGLLECTIHIGFPGSMSSIYQQIGRAGRHVSSKAKDSNLRRTGTHEVDQVALSIYIALDIPLEQHFMKFPDEFFKRRHGEIHLNPENEEILAQHLILAIREETLEYAPEASIHDMRFVEAVEEDPNFRTRIVRSPHLWFGTSAIDILSSMVETSQLYIRLDTTIPELVTSNSSNVDLTNIRAADNRRVSVVDVTTMKTIETLELRSALLELYEGSVYLHKAQSYVCQSFDPSKLVRFVKPHSKLSYFTTHIGHLSVRINGISSIQDIQYGGEHSTWGPSLLRVGKVSVSKDVYGYEIRSKKTSAVIDRKEIHQDPYVYDSRAVWSEVPTSVQEAYYAAKEEGISCAKGKSGKRKVETYPGEYDKGALHSIEVPCVMTLHM